MFMKQSITHSPSSAYQTKQQLKKKIKQINNKTYFAISNPYYVLNSFIIPSPESTNNAEKSLTWKNQLTESYVNITSHFAMQRWEEHEKVAEAWKSQQQRNTQQRKQSQLAETSIPTIFSHQMKPTNA